MIDPASRAAPEHPTPLALRVKARMQRYLDRNPRPTTQRDQQARFDAEEARAERTNDRSWAR